MKAQINCVPLGWLTAKMIPKVLHNPKLITYGDNMEEGFELINDDCLAAMQRMEENSIDFIVTDPPYGLHFMGKTWDNFKKTNFNEKGDYKYLSNSSVDGRSGTVRRIYSANACAGTYDPNLDDEFQSFMYQIAIEMLRILKPGGHVAMFGAPRRHHRQMSGLEDAGFEIRDCLMWIFGQGFPKSHNFGKKMDGEWEGYGTALKPAYEPIILAMKPLDGTYAQNAEKWGVAGINIDESRIGTEEREYQGASKLMEERPWSNEQDRKPTFKVQGRWPANLILDEEAADALDQQCKDNKMRCMKASGKSTRRSTSTNQIYGKRKSLDRDNIDFGDSGGASRFFYCAKASSRERNAGCENLPKKSFLPTGKEKRITCGGGKENFIPRENSHPTVKPLSLMRYIIKLLAPPGDPILLDPFCGSGSTLVAAKELGIKAIGIEKEKEYCQIAQARIKAA